MSTTSHPRQSGNRDAFLARTRRGSERTPTPHLLAPDADGKVNSGVAYTPDLSDPIAAFVAAATRQGATVVVVRDDGELAAAAADIVNVSGATEIAVADEPATRELAALLTQAGAPTRSLDDARSLGADDTILTGACAGIALTGSIVLASGTRRSRLTPIVPMTHVALLAADASVATPRDVYRGFAEGAWPGSALTIATGPSRSGDIEMQLTVGVHGPGVVMIVVDARD
mgnify:CR=1 FL=1